MTPLEKEIEAYLVTQVKARGGECLKWVSPGHAGVPDRICLLPDGEIIFVELKRPGGRISPVQEYWRRRLATLGYRHHYAYDKDDVDEILDGLPF